MLTPDQLKSLRTTVSSGGVQPGGSMTPEQAKAWITSSPTPTTRTSSFSGNTTPNAFGGNPVAALAGQAKDSIVGAAKGGIGQMGEAIQESKAGKNPIETGLKFGAGAVGTVFSPLAPVFAPVGGAINQAGEALSNTKFIKEAAAGLNSEYGGAQSPVERGLEDVSNASTLAQGVLGAKGGEVAAPKVGAAAVDVAGKVPGAVGALKESLTPKPVSADSFAAKAQAGQAKASAAIETEIRNLGEKYPSIGDALNKAEVNKGSEPIKVISSYEGGKALPTMNKGGKMNSLPAINFLRNQVNTLGEIKSNLVKTAKENVPLKEFKQAAIDRIDRAGWSVAKSNAEKTNVSKLIDSLKESYPKGIPAEELDKIKTEQAGESKSYNSKSPFSPDSHAIVGQTAADAVISKGGDAPIDELNKLLTSHYDAIKVLKTMNGKTPHGGMISRHAANIAGEVGGLAAGMAVGHPFLGAMAGRGASEAMNNILNNHFISNPLKRSLIRNMKGEKPEVIKQALDYLASQEGSPESTSVRTGDTPPPVEETPSSPNPTTVPEKGQDTGASVQPPTKEAPKVSPSTNDSIGNKPTPKTKRVAKPKNAGFAKLPSKPPQEALRTMSDFTDYVAGSLRLKGEEASSMEQEAADLFDKYVGGKAPTTLKGLSNTFGRLLEKHGFTPGEQSRDASGRFSR